MNGPAIALPPQVGWFRLTKHLHGEGKRLFRMAPLHHHLELLGWHETSVTALFVAVGAGLAVLAVWIASGAQGLIG